MIKKVISMCAAAALAVSLVGCGSTEESKANTDSKEEEIKITATEALTEQMNLLKNNDFSSEGSIGISLVMDDKSTDEQFSWSNITSDIEAMDISLGLNATWQDDKIDASINIGDSAFTSLAYDTEFLYVDLSSLKEILTTAGYVDESLDTDLGNGYSMGDVFTIVKIPKTEIESLSSGIVDEETTNTLKEGLSQDVIDELNNLSNKAEYDGEDIVISNLTKEDIKPLSEAIKKSMSDTDMSAITDNIIEEEENDTNATLSYKLSYSKDSLNQVHTFIFDSDESTITMTVSINDKGNINLDNYANAKTIEEITNNDFTFTTLVTTMFGGFASTDIEFDDDYYYAFEESGDLYENIMVGDFAEAY